MENYRLGIFVATGYEDVELITCIDLFKRAGLEYDLISVENMDMVAGAHNAFVKTIPSKGLKLAEYQGFLIPGGPGVKILAKSGVVAKAIMFAVQKELHLFAICSGPELLLKGGAIRHYAFTSYPGTCVVDNNTGGPLEISTNLITAKSLQYSVPFALAIIEKVLGKGKRMSVKKTI